MKKNLLFLGLIILGIGGYFFYQKRNQASSILTNFIPDNTLILLETNEISAIKNKIILRIPILSRANQQYQIFKKIGLSESEISNLLLKKTLYFAVLPEGRDDFSFVNYLPLTSDNEDFIEKLGTLNQNVTGYRVIPHTTQGYKILEVINSQSKMVFSYIIQQNFLIFSTSNLAVEEAILHKNNTWIKSLNLKSNNSESDSTFTITHLNQDAISNFWADISSEKSNISSQLTSLFPQTFQWLKPSANSLEAVSINNEQNLFVGQKANAMQNLNMIPNSCSYLLDFRFDNSKLLFQNVEENISNNQKISKLRSKASDNFDFDYTEIYSTIQDEISLCSFDNSDQIVQNKVLIIKQKGLLKSLNMIARNVAQEGEDDVFSVQYGSFRITNLGIKEFPSLLFGGIFGGFEECYFTEYNDKIIMASSLVMMQDFLINIGKGDVWSNSPKHKTILKSCIPSNLTMIAENTKALIGIHKILNKNWSNKIDTHEKELLNVQAEIFQSNAIESRFLFLKNIEPTQTPMKFSNKWVKLGSINLSINSEPLYLVNPSNKNAEILVQSKDNKLHLFHEGKQIWSYQLSGKIVGEIKNSRVFDSAVQQLLCLTNKNLYVLSRNEKGFEVKMSKPFKGFNLDNFKVFENETDHNKFLTLVAKNGNSFKFDKENLILTPSFRDSQLSEIISPVPSVIIKKTEYAVALSKSGKITLQNSSGKIVKGFPVDLEGVFEAAPLLEGEDNNIVVRVVSEKGELYKISLAGKILEKKQLFRPNTEVKFSMAMDERSTDWVLMRTDGKEVIVLDKNEQEIFTVKGNIYGKKALNYYNLGTEGKYFAINNGYTTYRFYDESGQSIGDLPVESDHTPRLSYSDSYQKVIMNITTANSIQTWSVKIR